MNRFHASMLVVSLTLCFTATAQRPPGPPDRAARQLLAILEQLDADAVVVVETLRRDAFIVAQLAAASGELQNFQKGVAVQKALDRVNAAGRRASARPAAHPEVIRLVTSAGASLEDAKKRGFSTDYVALERELENASRDVQPWVFRDILDMQKLRLALGDVQSHVSRMTQELDAATGEVLAATLEDARGRD